MRIMIKQEFMYSYIEMCMKENRWNFEWLKFIQKLTAEEILTSLNLAT